MYHFLFCTLVLFMLQIYENREYDCASVYFICVDREQNVPVKGQ